jgi:hypothetical protein
LRGGWSVSGVAESLIVDVLLRVEKVEDLVDMKVLIEDEVVGGH